MIEVQKLLKMVSDGLKSIAQGVEAIAEKIDDSAKNNDVAAEKNEEQPESLKPFQAESQTAPETKEPILKGVEQTEAEPVDKEETESVDQMEAAPVDQEETEPVEQTEAAPTGRIEGETAKDREAETAVKKPATAMETVLNIINSSAAGVNLSEIRSKTGYEQKKVSNIVYKLKKQGKIKAVKKGFYIKS